MENGSYQDKIFRFYFFSLLYGTPAPSAERQHTEAWPASTYGHLRDVSLKIVPANKVLFAGTVLANNLFLLFKLFKWCFYTCCTYLFDFLSTTLLVPHENVLFAPLVFFLLLIKFEKNNYWDGLF